MKKNDLEYLCAVIGNLAGIPIRIYQSGSLTFYHSLVALPADPIKPYAKKIFDIKDNLGYFTTPYFNYYGIVRSGQQTVVIGPSRQTPMSEQDMRALAFECDVKAESVGDFISAMKTLVQMPLGSKTHRLGRAVCSGNRDCAVDQLVQKLNSHRQRCCSIGSSVR